ncbi:MAG TPA: hypothetical protein VMT57_04355 [Candidatus Thermoplasmatota archaeon]|nr:hypothetical protein [Candidatus Thermoplasmatota archaeon]
MKKGLVLIVMALLLSVPIGGAVNQPMHMKPSANETTVIRCIVDGKRVEKVLPISTIQSLVDMGSSHKDDFLTIYDKTKTAQDVEQAFTNIQPFFQALIQSGLTDKTVEDLNNLYHGIREKIREPRRQPAWKPQDGGDARPLGIWNGIPTPVWGNILCGIFDVGTCAGFAGGTNAAIPTIGIDVFITYAFTGTSATVGLAGGTIATAAFQVIIGFVGVLIATPLVMIGPYFMTGLCILMIGIGA